MVRGAFNSISAVVAAAIFALAWTLPAGAVNLQEQDPNQSVLVARAIFTDAILPTKDPSSELTTIARGQQPYFWTLLSGNQAILDALKQQHKLPIYHSWRREVGGLPTTTELPGKMEADIPLDLGAPETVSKLQSEIDQSDVQRFTWRTWSHKLSLASGVWDVSLRFADGTYVNCLQQDGGNRPCFYRLKVE